MKYLVIRDNEGGQVKLRLPYDQSANKRDLIFEMEIVTVGDLIERDNKQTIHHTWISGFDNGVSHQGNGDIKLNLGYDYMSGPELLNDK